jgi:hypothetical protein
MDYQHILIEPISRNVGAEITGVDLSAPIPDATVAEIRRAIAARDAQRAAAAAENAKTMTFDQCAAGYIGAHRAGWGSCFLELLRCAWSSIMLRPLHRQGDRLADAVSVELVGKIHSGRTVLSFTATITSPRAAALKSTPRKPACPAGEPGAVRITTIPSTPSRWRRPTDRFWPLSGPSQLRSVLA